MTQPSIRGSGADCCSKLTRIFERPGVVVREIAVSYVAHSGNFPGYGPKLSDRCRFIFVSRVNSWRLPLHLGAKSATILDCTQILPGTSEATAEHAEFAAEQKAAAISKG